MDFPHRVKKGSFLPPAEKPKDALKILNIAAHFFIFAAANALPGFIWQGVVLVGGLLVDWLTAENKPNNCKMRNGAAISTLAYFLISTFTYYVKPYIIGICGGSGSGKTSFIRDLRRMFSESDVCIVSQDDYYFPRHEQKKDDKGVINFDLPRSIDKKAFKSDLETLISGKPVVKKEYVFNNEAANAKTLTFQPAPVLIVEGLFVFHYKKIAALFDLKVFVNAKENLKIIRRIKRDQIERNYPIEDVLYRYEHHVMPAYERFIEPYREAADIVVNNNDDFERGLNVVSGFIRHKVLSTGMD